MTTNKGLSCTEWLSVLREARETNIQEPKTEDRPNRIASAGRLCYLRRWPLFPFPYFLLPQRMRILVTGANGQIGSDLVHVLRARHGAGQVVALDLHPPQHVAPRGGAPTGEAGGPHVALDVRDGDGLARVIEEHNIRAVYHLASLLSATGERRPDRTWDVNMTGLKHVLDLARARDLKVFWPSSIAVFGPATPRAEAPQETVLDPRTMYGVTKVSGELLCRYYHQKHGVDVRSLRYPGLISYAAPPGGGTTDYAVDMFYAAARGEPCTCFVRPSTRLPMMYMPDAIRAALDLMAAPPEAVRVRTSYNVGALSFTAEALEAAIRRHVPGFACTYAPDDRQQIADSWPEAVDDGPARTDWSWQPRYDLDAMVEDMLAKLREKASLEVRT